MEKEVSTTPAPVAEVDPASLYPTTPSGKQAQFDIAMQNPQYRAYWEKLHPDTRKVLDEHRAA